MLATFGLDRLEAGLAVEAVAADAVDDLLVRATSEQGRASGARADAAAHDVLPLKAPPLRGRPVPQWSSVLPVRGYPSHRPNPLFQPPRQIDRV